MKIKAALLLPLALMLALPALAHPPITPQYQEVVTWEPYPGGGGGAICFMKITTRYYSNGDSSETNEVVCIPG